MSLQAIYQALTERNLPLSDEGNRQAEEVLRHLPGHSYWALIQSPDSPSLKALYQSAGDDDCLPTTPSWLENTQLQECTGRLAEQLEGPGPWWVFLGPRPPRSARPPRFIDPGLLPQDLELARRLRREPKQPDSESCGLALVKVEPISVEVSPELVWLVKSEAPLYERVKSVRRHLALELGIILPGVHFRDNYQLKPGEYLIKLRELAAVGGRVELGKLLCVHREEVLRELPGELTKDPTYQMPAKWVEPHLRSRYEALGCMLFDVVSVIATQLTDCLRRRTAELLTLEDAHQLLNQKDCAYLLSPLEKVGLNEVALWKIMRQLLEERVSIRDLTTLLQGLLLADDQSVPPLERARQALARTITQSLCENGQLRALSLTEQQEAVLTGPDRSAAQQLAQSLCWSFQKRGFQPIFLSSLAGRRTLSQVFRNQECSAAVLSWAEVVPGTKVIELEDSSS